MVSTNSRLPMYYFSVRDILYPIKNLFRKILQTSLEFFLIGVLFDQVAGLEIIVNFVKFLRTILCRTTVAACRPWEVLWKVSVLEIKNSSKKL